MSPQAVIAATKRTTPRLNTTEARLLQNALALVRAWSPVAPSATAPWDRPEHKSTAKRAR